MIKKNISRIAIILILLSSPIIFTQCSAFKTANKVATSINNISDMILNYDSIAKNYLSIAKKAKSGDPLAILQAGEILSKAIEYKKDLDRLMPKMSSSQKKQVANIESAILKAAKELMK